MNGRINVVSVMDRARRTISAQSKLSDDVMAHLADDMMQARAAVAELIEADHEYESARRDWDHVTAHDPEETSDETWQKVADRFEAAVMRRAAALARVGSP